jgi:hypothetical protein
VPIAEAAWGGPPPCRQLTLEVVPQLSEPTDSGSAAMGEASQDPEGNCLVQMVDGQKWVDFCTVLVHEYGHLHGLEHSADPASPMYVDPREYPACVDAAIARLTAEGGAQAGRELTAIGARERRAHRRRCTRLRRRVHRAQGVRRRALAHRWRGSCYRRRRSI